MEIAVRISASQFWGSNLVSLFLVLYVLALFSVCTPTTDTFLLTIHLKSLSKSRWFYCVPPLDNIKLDRVSKFNTTFFSVLNTVKFHSFYQMYKNIKFSENFFFHFCWKISLGGGPHATECYSLWVCLYFVHSVTSNNTTSWLNERSRQWLQANIWTVTARLLN